MRSMIPALVSGVNVFAWRDTFLDTQANVFRSAACKATTRFRVSHENQPRANGSSSHAIQRGRIRNWYRNTTLVAPSPAGLNSQAPPNDSNIEGPRVILTAASLGGANETYSVSMAR